VTKKHRAQIPSLGIFGSYRTERDAFQTVTCEVENKDRQTKTANRPKFNAQLLLPIGPCTASVTPPLSPFTDSWTDITSLKTNIISKTLLGKRAGVSDNLIDRALDTDGPRTTPIHYPLVQPSSQPRTSSTPPLPTQGPSKLPSPTDQAQALDKREGTGLGPSSLNPEIHRSRGGGVQGGSWARKRNVTAAISWTRGCHVV